MGGTRSIAYTYDGLLRLTGAVETPGTAFSYAYDLTGNRIAATQNGVLVEQRAYDAANQVVGLAYDAMGNLLNDASTTYTYDALNRLTQQGSTSNTYNGDGVLVRQVNGGTTTDYTQDLAAPLTQILQSRQGGTTTTHLYGRDRLATVTGATRSWYGTDALGSVRLTFGDSGTVLGGANYDPWGTVEGSAVAPFGFTGELQDTAAGLVNLRARWYSTAQGRFTSRDSFPSSPERPQTLAQYSYAEDNPIDKLDPSGHLAIFVAGWFGQRPTSGEGRPGIWDMAERFKGFIQGETIISDPGGPKALGGALPTPSRNDIVNGIINKIESVSASSQDACPPMRPKHEPIILVGHSRGAGTIQQALGELYLRNPNIRVDLVVTLGVISVSQRDWWHAIVFRSNVLYAHLFYHQKAHPRADATYLTINALSGIIIGCSLPSCRIYLTLRSR